MSLLINGKLLEVGIALRDDKHPMYNYAVQYEDGIRELKTKFQDVIKFVRPGFPKTNKGSDSRGNEVMLVEPPTPAMFPLETPYAHPQRGEEIWSCCLQTPKLLPNGLWAIGNKRSMKIDEFVNVDLRRQPDLAFYLYYIYLANPRKQARLKVDDPKAEIRAKADKERQLVERKTAIWQMLTDETALRKIAAAYGVNGAYTKEPDQLRFDLEGKLEENDKRRKNDISIKGTRDFLDEMKVTDNVRLRAFLQKLIDDKKLVYKPDGRFRLGDKLLMQVPQSEINRRFEFLCGYYTMSSNNDKLQELLRDVVNKQFLDDIADPKDYTWLLKVMGGNTAFKKTDEVKDAVYAIFNVA